MKAKDITRFWSKVEKADGCWIWQAGKTVQGYGVFRVSGKGRKAHRIAYELTYGPIPTGLCVCHHCDNPSCVRPDHLWLGTNRENTHDRHRKGRTVMCRNTGGYKLKPGSRIGEKAARWKLLNRQVDEIRAKYEAHTATIEVLAIEYGISPYTVRDIVKYKTRTKHLNDYANI